MVESITKFEIQRQPKFIAETLSDESSHTENLARKIAKSKNRRMFFVGCGSSYCSAYLAKYISDSLTNIHSDALSGYDFAHRLPMNVDKDSYVFLTSFSGETEEAVRALEAAKKRGAYTVGVTSTRNSTLYKETDDPFFLKDFDQNPMVGGYSTQVSWFYWLIAQISKLTISLDRAEEILQQFKQLPEILSRIVETEEKKMAELAREYKEKPGFYVIGSGPLYSLAYKFALTMLTENVWMHGCAVDGGEFRHGLIERIEKGVPVIVLKGYEGQDSMTERVLRFVRAHGAETIVFDAVNYPRMDEVFLPLLLSIPAEWFTYYLSLERGRLPEYRRYMKKEPF